MNMDYISNFHTYCSSITIEVKGDTSGTYTATYYTPGYSYTLPDPKPRYKNNKIQVILERQYSLAQRSHNKTLMKRLKKQMEANIANN